jgi:hypothetical protein
MHETNEFNCHLNAFFMINPTSSAALPPIRLHRSRPPGGSQLTFLCQSLDQTIDRPHAPSSPNFAPGPRLLEGWPWQREPALSTTRLSERSNKLLNCDDVGDVSHSRIVLITTGIQDAGVNSSQTPRFAEQAECNWIPGSLHGSQPIDPELVSPFADLLTTTSKKASNI